MDSIMAQTLCMDMEVSKGKDAALELAQSMHERGYISTATYTHIVSTIL